MKLNEIAAMNIRFMKQQGITLVELMIAMTISLLLTAATFTVFLENRATARSMEIVARMQENARVALDIIGRDIKLAGYYGLTSNTDWLQGINGSDNQLGKLAGDCASRWYIDLATPIWAIDNTNPYAGCISSTDYQANTDILVIRRASTVAADVAGDPATYVGKVLLRTSHSSGVIYLDPNNPPTVFSGNVEDREIFARAYYIRPNFVDSDAIPTLVFENLQDGGTSPEVAAQELVPGVEQFQVQLGIDADGDGTVDFYRDPETGATPSVIDVNSIRAVRLWLLMRAEDREFDITDTNTYTMGSLQYTPAADVQNYRRALFTTTVKVRNKFTDEGI